MRGKLVQKLCAVALTAVMMGGTGLAEVGSFVGTSLSVSAATAETAASSFEYEIKNGAVIITAFIGEETNVVIPRKIEGKLVTTIGDSAFSRNTNLESVVIPDTVESIGRYTFNECSGLKSVTIGENVRDIYDHAFCECTSLTSVTLPGLLRIIGGGAFMGCTGLEKIVIPNSVTTIYDDAFKDCTGLKSVSIPNSVNSWGGYVFCGCTGLTSVTLPKGLESISNGMFDGCTELTDVSLPSTLKEIPSDTFKGCISLTKVNIPEGVETIGYAAFGYCKYLTSVSIPKSVTSIGNYAFQGCSSLKSVVIPGSVKVIDTYTFADCYRLASVTISNGVEEIMWDAFQNCTSLKEVDLPVSVKEIVQNAFDSCTRLSAVTIHNKNVFFRFGNPFTNCPNLTVYGIKDSTADEFAKKYEYPFVAILYNKSKVTPSTVYLGSSVTVKCAATGGAGSYTYAVYYKKAGTTTWKTLQSYQANATVRFTPAVATNYVLRVAVKDKNGDVERKDMKVTVQKPLTNTSKLSADTIKLGEKVKVRCFAQNGETPYKFTVEYKKSTSSKWTTLAADSSNNIFLMKPGAAVSYDIRVTVKSEDGQTAVKTLTLKVTK